MLIQTPGTSARFDENESQYKRLQADTFCILFNLGYETMPIDMIDFDVNGVRISCAVDKLDALSSVHTGNRLLCGEGRISVPEREMNEVLSFIETSNARPAVGLRRSTRSSAKWRLVRGNYSCGTGTANIAVKLSEFESLMTDSLSIDSTRYDVLAYKEEPDGPGIAIRAILQFPTAGADTLHRFHADNEYHDVIRHGISDHGVRMRFGLAPLWSQHEGFVKYSISLFDERSDRHRSEDRPIQIPLFHRETAVAGNVAYRAELLESLMRALVDKDVLTADEIEAMRQAAMGGAPRRLAQFTQVADAQDYEF